MSSADLEKRLSDIATAVQASPNAADHEHLLVELAKFLDSDAVSREQATAVLIATLSGLRPACGAIEAVEFTMHQLRWPEVHAGLIALSQDGKTETVRHVAGRMLAAFRDDWEGREVYPALRR